MPYTIVISVIAVAFLNPNSLASIPHAFMHGTPMVAATPNAYICKGVNISDKLMPKAVKSIAPVRSFWRKPKIRGIAAFPGNHSHININDERGFTIKLVASVISNIP